nr:hypothetical protein [uncultured Desulfobulbus sp.]
MAVSKKGSVEYQIEAGIFGQAKDMHPETRKIQLVGMDLLDQRGIKQKSVARASACGKADGDLEETNS